MAGFSFLITPCGKGKSWIYWFLKEEVYIVNKKEYIYIWDHTFSTIDYQITEL